MSTIPEEYLSDYDFGFNAVEEIPQSNIQIDAQPIAEDVEGINDNVLRIEQKVDALVTAMNGLSTKMMNLDDEFDVIKSTTEQEVKSKLTEVEKLVMPLLVNLLKTADKDYIHWPNRQDKIQAQIDRLLSLTRGA
jgi:peptidoglycan hydrolase CwlO-like protein